MIAIQDKTDDLEFNDEHLQMLSDLNNMIVTSKYERVYSCQRITSGDGPGERNLTE